MIMYNAQFPLCTDLITVELRSKGPGRKGIPLIREILSSPIDYFPIHFYIGYKGISVYGKN